MLETVRCCQLHVPMQLTRKHDLLGVYTKLTFLPQQQSAPVEKTPADLEKEAWAEKHRHPTLDTNMAMSELVF